MQLPIFVSLFAIIFASGDSSLAAGNRSENDRSEVCIAGLIGKDNVDKLTAHLGGKLRELRLDSTGRDDQVVYARLAPSLKDRLADLSRNSGQTEKALLELALLALFEISPDFGLVNKAAGETKALPPELKAAEAIDFLTERIRERAKTRVTDRSYLETLNLKLPVRLIDELNVQARQLGFSSTNLVEGILSFAVDLLNQPTKAESAVLLNAHIINSTSKQRFSETQSSVYLRIDRALKERVRDHLEKSHFQGVGFVGFVSGALEYALPLMRSRAMSQSNSP